jgi:hypothetical protein
MNLFEMFEQGPPEPTLIDALRDFLPIAVKHLDLDHIPKIKLVKTIVSGDQPAFGQYSVEEQAIEVAVNNRNPADILRTLAHEIVHYVQGQHNELDADSGRTGSPIEDEANAEAGVIMRIFAKQHPRYLSLPAVEVPNQLEEKRRRKKKNKSRSYGGYYGYYWGGNDSGDSSGGDGGGGESMEENFADGKKPGRKGLSKRSGVNCKASVTSLRKTAKNSSGEKQRMAHWCANMKSGKKK